MMFRILTGLATVAAVSAPASTQVPAELTAKVFGVCISSFIQSGDDGNFNETETLSAFRRNDYVASGSDPLVLFRPGFGHAGLIRYGEFYDYTFNQTIGEFGCAVFVVSQDIADIADAVRSVAAEHGEILDERIDDFRASFFLQPPDSGAFSIHISPEEARNYPGHTAILIQYGGQ
ncbi:MAG: hypothetical protein RIA71_07305 [Oceanicaulis sp.]